MCSLRYAKNISEKIHQKLVVLGKGIGKLGDINRRPNVTLSFVASEFLNYWMCYLRQN